ncbi:hypothetical protein DYB26_010051 [Aphanomyces astaci]|uniref:Uncharacterized protein n=1 Tax=Aphanomyces astaci TaxID=112090 RepID=A0A397FW02_APHAT|nr:hypothetical protein DYB26_010051 [Aphanomyces astaci]RHZ41629.1 hypothetical protein DYB31_005064 [Aphanomyces astaci]
MDTANASAMQGMVDLYMQSTQWTKAKSVLLKLLLADPTHQAPRLQLATCEMHLANYGRAVTILQELLSTPSLTPDMHHDASILLATALYECGSIKDQDKAVSILVHLLDKSNHTDMDAMALYSQVAHDRGKPAQAMQMMLKVLVDRPKDKRTRGFLDVSQHTQRTSIGVQAKCAAFLEAPRGFEYLQLALDPTSPSTAPAYAYLASVAKDHGAMTGIRMSFELGGSCHSCSLRVILFLQGCLRPVPALVDAIEPLRYHYGHLLHTTSIRNEHAYYSCITQLVTIPSLHVPRPRPSSVIYVCGDSHALATAWRSVGAHVLVPALVTGLKHCTTFDCLYDPLSTYNGTLHTGHLRKTSTFYPKVHFFNVIKSIPRGATVVFVFGEIDCREGLLVAVEKCRYEVVPSVEAYAFDSYSSNQPGKTPSSPRKASELRAHPSPRKGVTKMRSNLMVPNEVVDRALSKLGVSEETLRIEKLMKKLGVCDHDLEEYDDCTTRFGLCMLIFVVTW